MQITSYRKRTTHMGTAITKISVEAIRHVFDLPADCDIEVAPTNEDGCVTLIVTHDSIPEDATNVTAIIRRQVYQHESLTFGHFATAEQVAELNNDVNSMETPDLTPA
jgi:hypothetical protein